MTMLRILFSYGQTRRLPHCDKLNGILAEMRFKNTPPRKTVMTYEQVVAFIAKAHELGRSDLARAGIAIRGHAAANRRWRRWLRPSGDAVALGEWSLWEHIRDYAGQGHDQDRPGSQH
jgi:hypothetical protein